MKTTATNRKIREILQALRNGTLVPRPDFQRRLVWNNKDKTSFLETVLLNYPFPEVYVAAGDVNVDTGEGTELLVDGQQRLTTLLQYFQGSPDLVLTGASVRPYSELAKEAKEAFLQYDVVVRDLGQQPLDSIRAVFQRINATRYALNAMEIHNSRYEGEFKAFAEGFAQRPFFDLHRVFSASDIRRMQDVRFVVVLAATVLSTYFNRDEEVEAYLQRFNDEFPLREDLERELDETTDFVERMNLPPISRAWKRADLFTLLVEVHRAIFKTQVRLEPRRTAAEVEHFFALVEKSEARSDPTTPAGQYYKAALQATNDRSSRVARGEIVRVILEGVAAQPAGQRRSKKRGA